MPSHRRDDQHRERGEQQVLRVRQRVAQLLRGELRQILVHEHAYRAVGQGNGLVPGRGERRVIHGKAVERGRAGIVEPRLAACRLPGNPVGGDARPSVAGRHHGVAMAPRPRWRPTSRPGPCRRSSPEAPSRFRRARRTLRTQPAQGRQQRRQHVGEVAQDERAQGKPASAAATRAVRTVRLTRPAFTLSICTPLPTPCRMGSAPAAFSFARAFANVHRYRRRGAFRVPSQHVLHDLVARERLAGMARQELAHVELGLRQRHGGLAHVRLARCEVETQRAERQRVLALAPLAPQVRGHLRAQLGRAEGLAHVVVRPRPRPYTASSSAARAVRNTMGASTEPRMARHSSNPSMPGIITSSSTRS